MINAIYKGDNTGAFGNTFLTIGLNNPLGYTISKAIFVTGCIQKIYENPVFPLRINFNEEETPKEEITWSFYRGVAPSKGFMISPQNIPENITGYIIDGTSADKFSINGHNKGGIEVGSGQTLTMQNLGNVYGFAGDAVTNAGTFNVSDSTFTSGIKNTNALNFTGTNTITGSISDASTATGTTTVSSGETTFGSVTQKAFVNAGTTNIAANNLIISTTVDNQGTLNLGSGDLASNIGQTTATGTTNIVGEVTNTSDKTITQNNVTIASGNSLTTKANLVTSTNAIANAGTLNLAGGELASAISGAGTTNITADVTSAKVVSQDVFTTTAGKTYTNATVLALTV